MHGIKLFRINMTHAGLFAQRTSTQNKRSVPFYDLWRHEKHTPETPDKQKHANTNKQHATTRGRHFGVFFLRFL